MKILITGSSGYVGTELVKFFLKEGHQVIGVDIEYFGNKNKKQKKFRHYKLCTSKIKSKHLKGVDVVIHLAAISNDPSALLDSKITWETNVLFTLNLLKQCEKAKIKKFIFASSGSVYGVSTKSKVDEKTELLPISDYNKSKMIGEIIVNKFKKSFKIVILRPGTICGYSDNMRLDLTVNAIAFTAIKNKQIIVNGGQQVRPQLHIQDMLLAYNFSLKKNITGTFNVGFENYKIIKIAQMVKNTLKDTSIKVKKIDDIRSYRLFPGKFKKKGFKPSKNTQDAINDIIFYNKIGKIKNNSKSYRSNFLKKVL